MLTFFWGGNNLVIDDYFCRPIDVDALNTRYMEAHPLVTPFYQWTGTSMTYLAIDPQTYTCMEYS